MESKKYQGQNIVTALAEGQAIQDMHHGLRNRQELPHTYISRQEKTKKRTDYAFGRQFNEKPRTIPGCPGHA